MTFRTPFGRYCWLRLPFGLNVSQYALQSWMDQHLDGLTGVESIADNIIVFGENEEYHNRKLINLVEPAERKDLVFNSKKYHIKQISVSFFGNRYTPDGIKPDPDKVRYIRNMAHRARETYSDSWDAHLPKSVHTTACLQNTHTPRPREGKRSLDMGHRSADQLRSIKGRDLWRRMPQVLRQESLR